MNEKLVSLILNIAVFVIAVIGVFLIINAMGTAPEVDPETGQDVMDTSAVSSSVSYSLALLYGGGIFIAVFTIWGIIMNPKKFIPTAIGLVVFGLLVLIGYSMSTVETTGAIVKLEDATEASLRWGGVGIQTTFVLVIVAIGLIVLQMVRGILGYFQK
ncbi:MAG: hypothetical protein MI810_00940 [Flavobacteriales bacterium]|nr:hypothetical protein [Flavobacteriales bacterium]